MFEPQSVQNNSEDGQPEVTEGDAVMNLQNQNSISESATLAARSQ
jgi:hypothetical protein